MTREEIENIPKNVNTLLDLSVTMHTRQKLYEKLNKMCELAIMVLEQELKTNWIPVSERLPENSGVYIVSRWFTDGFDEMILTDACYFDGTSTWHNDNRINHDREYVDKKIVAWMPLPEPYKMSEIPTGSESEG